MNKQSCKLTELVESCVDKAVEALHLNIVNQWDFIQNTTLAGQIKCIVILFSSFLEKG